MEVVRTSSVQPEIRNADPHRGIARQAAAQKLCDHPKAKLLKRILDLILVEVPRDPNAAEFQLGNTLGSAYRHWRRAKFLGRFRLFFRLTSTHKAIVYACVNDETTLRKAGAQTDPYAVFTRRIQEGNPPDGWDALLQESEAADPSSLKRIIPDSKD